MTDQTLAEQQAAGLRKLADLIEAHPELARDLEHTLTYSGINAHMDTEDRAARQAEWARAALKFGAKVTKDINDQWHNLNVDLGGVKVDVLAYREEVCERVVTGTETVTKRVKDPVRLAAVPEVEVTETVETFEWRCAPLLADAEVSA